MGKKKNEEEKKRVKEELSENEREGRYMQEKEG